MLNTFLKDNADEERIELEKLRQDLEQVNEARVRDLEESKRLEEEVLLKGQAAVDALAAKQKKAKEDQERLDRALHEDQRKKESKMTAEDHIKEVMKQFTQQNNEIMNLQLKEREDQMEKTLQAVNERKRKKENDRAKAEAELKQREQEATAEREKQVAKVTAERAKRDELLKSIHGKQKLLLKECYSRPLYTFNRVVHENQIQNEDFNWLTEAKNSELQRQSVQQLL